MVLCALAAKHPHTKYHASVQLLLLLLSLVEKWVFSSVLKVDLVFG